MSGLRVLSDEPANDPAGWQMPRQHLVQSQGWLSFLPAPPPDFALSEPLLGGLQGWLRAVSDMQTCSPAQHRGARRRGSGPRAAEEERPREHVAMRSRRRRQETGATTRWKNDEKTKQNCSLVARRCSRWWRRVSTWKDADSSIRRSCPSVEEWRRGARLSLEKIVEGQWR